MAELSQVGVASRWDVGINLQAGYDLWQAHQARPKLRLRLFTPQIAAGAS